MIEIKGVNKSFSNIQVLKNVNLTIEEGEIFGIVGHSGAGKSTLLRCLNRLETQDSGRIVVMGQEVKTLDGAGIRNLRKDLGMIFQNFNLLNRKNVFENVALPLEIWGMKESEIKERVEKLLRLVGIEEKIYSMPRELSGGQKQRVAIARALALEPKILLCDEATSALDPSTTKAILQLLREINEKLKLTIVIVTHQMEVVKEICSGVALMEGGCVLAVGPVEKLFLNPAEPLKKLIGEEEMLPSTGVNIKLFFPKEHSQQCIITTMARGLDINFSIVWGKLEKFRQEVLGTLVINVDAKDVENIKSYLNEREIAWEVIKYVD